MNRPKLADGLNSWSYGDRTKIRLNFPPPEVRPWVVAMVLDHGGDHRSQWSSSGSVSSKIDCTPDTLTKSVFGIAASSSEVGGRSCAARWVWKLSRCGC